MSTQPNAGLDLIESNNEIILKFKARIPFKNYRVRKKLHGQGNMAHGHFGLTKIQVEKLKNMAKKGRTTRSHIIRQAIDAYWLKLNKEPNVECITGKKYPVQGLQVVPVTIRKDQDSWLQMMVEKTGKKRSELGREAFEYYVQTF
jgi:predicted DNA-binding protein